MLNRVEIPKVFEGAVDYRENCVEMDVGQATLNEERLYVALTGFAEAWHQENNRAARLLDLCCATGLTANRIASAIPVDMIALVDIDADMLRNAEGRCSRKVRTETYCTDAVTFGSKGKYDLILMNSSYHHIEDARKLDFLKNAASLLAAGGVLLVGENFIFDYGNGRSKQDSIIRFYERLLEWLAERGESSHALNVIRRSGLYCWEGFYEYKVPRSRFLADAAGAGLVLLEHAVVWSASNEVEGFAGSCALRLGRISPSGVV